MCNRWIGKKIQIYKLSISTLSIFSSGKISCKTFNYENKLIQSRLKNYQVLKKPSRLTQYFSKLSWSNEVSFFKSNSIQKLFQYI